MADKKNPRGLLDMLGKGAARNAGEAIARRKQQLDDAINDSKPKKKVKR